MLNNNNNINLDIKDKKGQEDSLVNMIYSGTRWTAFGKISAQIVRFGVSIVLARLLAPQDFGLMAMALVVTGFIEIFKDMGTVASIIQKSDVNNDLLSSLFYLNLLFGLFCGGTIALFAGVVAKFYGDLRLVNILRLLSITFIITSVSLVKKALMERNMMFNKIAIVELATILIQGTIAIVFAYFGWGVWSLIFGVIVSSIVSTGLYWASIPWYPTLIFRWSDIRSVLYFSINLSGATTLAYIMTNIDKLIIGRYFGASSLGFYDLARRLLSLPGSTITDVLGRVLFPGFSKIKNDNYQLRHKLLRAFGAISIITFPILCGMWVMARPLVLVVYGAKWEPVVTLIHILTPVSIMLSLAVSLGPMIYLTKGRTDLLFLWHIVVGIFSTLGYLVGLRWGMNGVATGYLISQILLTYPIFAIPFRLIDMKFIDFLQEIKPYGLFSVFMVIIVYVFKNILYYYFNMNIMFVICVAIGAATYLLLILKYKPKAYYDFNKTFMIQKMLSKVN